MNIYERSLFSTDLEETEKNFLFFYSGCSYVENGTHRWFDDEMEAASILSCLGSYKNIDEFFNIYPFYREKCGNWTLQILAESALYYYLEKKITERQRYKEALITSYEWELISTLIVNSFLSDGILAFVKQTRLLDISPNSRIIFGCYKALDTTFVFEANIFTEKGLQNLLLFLNVDKISSKYLINKTLQLKNFDLMKNFIKNLNS